MKVLSVQRFDLALECIQYGGYYNNINNRDTSGKQWTALHFASYLNSFECVCQLVKMGADIKMGDGDGHTAQGIAHKRGNHHIAKFLQGKWFVLQWNPSIHNYCPMEFQKETLLLLKVINRYCHFYKDVKFKLIQALFDLHKPAYKKQFCQIRNINFPLSYQSLLN